MTLLPDLTDFQGNGANTYERLILRGTQMLLHLQGVYSAPGSVYAYRDRVLMAVSESVDIEISFVLHSNSHINKGQFKVLPFQNDSPFALTPVSPAPTQLFCQPYPSWVTDLENAIVWAALSLNRPEQITVRPDYEINRDTGVPPNQGSLVVTASLPLDLTVLAQTGGDLIAASTRINTDIPDYFA